MKILLWGEYSGVHTDLKIGLQKLGHEVILVSTGDGFKKFNVDYGINLSGVNKFTRLKNCFVSYRGLKEIDLSSIDVFQAINPGVNGGMKASIFLRNIFNTVPKKSLLVCGDDFYVWKAYELNHLFKRWVRNIPERKFNTKYLLNYRLFGYFNCWFANNVDFIVPKTNGLYQRAYQGWKNCVNPIAFPVNLDKIPYHSNTFTSKITFFHGKTGRWEKGSDVIVEALNKVKNRYPSDVNIKIVERLPYTDYLRELRSSNVVVDQVCGDSLGMNSLYSMAFGKLVLTSYDEDNLPVELSVVRISDCVQDVVSKLEMIIENRNQIEKLGLEARNYVERHHNYIDIANKYLKLWDSTGSNV